MKPMLKIFAKFPRGAILPITQVVASLKEHEQCDKLAAQVKPSKPICAQTSLLAHHGIFV